MTKELRGALLFSEHHPQVTGTVTINGEEFAVCGWWASKMRVNLEGELIERAEHEHRE